MKKHDSLFIALTSVSVILLGLIISDNINSRLSQEKAKITEAETKNGASQGSIEALQKKFADMGLKPHEGKYWKKESQ